MLAPEAMRRLTLLINHVLSREAVATARLRPHAGRTLRLRVRDLPPWLPAPADLRFAVTPAGLLEWMPEATAAADLDVVLSLADPLTMARRALQGHRPEVQVDGDASLAADVDWIASHLRWDIADDLERMCGPLVAQAWVQAAAALRSALSAVSRQMAELSGRSA